MSKLEWTDVDECHKRAAPSVIYAYDIIHTPDGQVSWQGPATDWARVESVEAAIAAADQDWQSQQMHLGLEL